MAVLYGNGGVVTRKQINNDDTFKICCKVETPLYTSPPAAKVPTLKDQLNSIITFVFDNDDRFLDDHYGHHESCELLEFYMASERCRFSVINYEGETIRSTASTDDILNWRDELLSAQGEK